MRWIWLIVGIVALGVGIVWTLQGFNVLSGSGMSGKTVFILLGLIVGVIGLVLIGFGLTRSSTPAA